MTPPICGRDGEKRVDLDNVFNALSHTVRRRILVAIMTDNPRWQDEFETMEFRAENREREPIRIEIYHQHLPLLDEGDFIDWDRETGQIRRGEHFEDIRPLLELLDNHRDELPDDWP